MTHEPPVAREGYIHMVVGPGEECDYHRYLDGTPNGAHALIQATVERGYVYICEPHWVEFNEWATAHGMKEAEVSLWNPNTGETISLEERTNE